MGIAPELSILRFLSVVWLLLNVLASSYVARFSSSTKDGVSIANEKFGTASPDITHRPAKSHALDSAPIQPDLSDSNKDFFSTSNLVASTTGLSDQLRQNVWDRSDIPSTSRVSVDAYEIPDLNEPPPDDRTGILDHPTPLLVTAAKQVTGRGQHESKKIDNAAPDKTLTGAKRKAESSNLTDKSSKTDGPEKSIRPNFQSPQREEWSTRQNPESSQNEQYSRLAVVSPTEYPLELHFDHEMNLLGSPRGLPNSKPGPDLSQIGSPTQSTGKLPYSGDSLHPEKIYQRQENSVWTNGNHQRTLDSGAHRKSVASDCSDCTGRTYQASILSTMQTKAIIASAIESGRKFSMGRILEETTQGPNISPLARNIKSAVGSELLQELPDDINITFSYLLGPRVQKLTNHITEEWIAWVRQEHPTPLLEFDARRYEPLDPELGSIYRKFIQESFMISDNKQLPNLAEFCGDVKRLTLVSKSARRLRPANASPSTEGHEGEVEVENQAKRLSDSYFLLIGYSHGLRPAWLRFLRSQRHGHQDFLARAQQVIVAKERLRRLGLLQNIRDFFSKLPHGTELSEQGRYVWGKFFITQTATIIFLYNLMLLHQVREIFDGRALPLTKQNLLFEWNDLKKLWEACYPPRAIENSENEVKDIPEVEETFIQKIKEYDSGDRETVRKTYFRVNMRHKLLLSRWLHRITKKEAENFRIDELPSRKLDGLEVFLHDCSMIEFLQS